MKGFKESIWLTSDRLGQLCDNGDRLVFTERAIPGLYFQVSPGNLLCNFCNFYNTGKIFVGVCYQNFPYILKHKLTFSSSRKVGYRPNNVGKFFGEVNATTSVLDPFTKSR